MTSASKRLSKQDCVDLRAQLADLGYVQAEAETPELFAHRLYPVSEHLRALDRNVVLVVGPRGSGKSALFQALFWGRIAESRRRLRNGCRGPRF